MTKASSAVASVTQQYTGKEFHSLGPSTENARRRHEFRRYDGTTSWWPAAERDDLPPNGVPTAPHRTNFATGAATWSRW